MYDLIYDKIININDEHIPLIKEIHDKPEVSKYINISDNYFNYVTTTEKVYFYKVFNKDVIIGTIHLEIYSEKLYMDILVFPEFQRLGYGTKILSDIKRKVLGLEYKAIEVAVDENNIASLRLFENAGFVTISKEDELINLAYKIEG